MIAVRRPGLSLAEMLVACALGGIVALALGGVLRAQERVVRRQTEEAAAVAALRVTAGVLAAEVRALRPATDLRGVGSDSVALRVFRGFGIACGGADEGVIVRYRGLRLPDPAKDSILFVGSSTEPVASLGGSADAPAGACAPFPGERLLRLSLAAEPGPGTLLLVFESGSYHLADDAFRYRRGRSGRQPLTGERIDTRASTLRAYGPGGSTTGDPAQATVIEALLHPQTDRGAPDILPFRLRVPLRNPAPP